MPPEPLDIRLFWTWDHSMDWDPARLGGRQEHGCANYYYKRSEAFLEDYKRLVDFCAREGFDGIVVYGFLRDAHGGVESAKELCNYGKDKGVRIIPGIGINSYGGVFWEGNHEYNLPTWLANNPDLRCVGQPDWQNWCLRMSCPSRPENIQWHLDAISWLTETFEIGGINFENGDYGVCKCDLCTSKKERDFHYSSRDIADTLPPLIEAALKIKPDMLPIVECYFDNVLDIERNAVFKDFPEKSIMQYCINRPFWEEELKPGLTPEIVAQLPTHRKILRTHMGSQWGNERHLFTARTFMELAKVAAATGIEGTNIFGEVSDRSPKHLLNYLALARTAENPELTWDGFVDEFAAPLFGGAEPARRFIHLLENDAPTDGDMSDVRAVLKDTDGDAFWRWHWMADDLRRKLAATAPAGPGKIYQPDQA